MSETQKALGWHAATAKCGILNRICSCLIHKYGMVNETLEAMRDIDLYHTKYDQQLKDNFGGIHFTTTGLPQTHVVGDLVSMVLNV